MLPPVYFPRGSVVLQEIQKHTHDLGQPPNVYTTLQSNIELILLRCGFAGDFQKVAAYHPCHNWVQLKTLTDPSHELEIMDKQKYGFEYNTAGMVDANSVAVNNPWQSTAPKIIGKEKGAVAKLNFLPDSFSTK